MKKYSMLSNEIWLLKLVVGYEKRYPLLLVSLIAAKLLLPLVSTLLPAAAVAALTRGGGMGQYLAVIAGLMVLYAAGTFLRDWLENRNIVLMSNFRMEVAVAMVMEKAMTMDYRRLEPAEGQKRLSAAKNMAGNFSDTLFLALRDIVAYGVLISAFLSGQMDAAGFTFSLGVLATLTGWLNEFIKMSDELRYCNIGFSDFRDYMEQDDASPKGDGAKAACVRRPPRVELRDVTFTYPDAKMPTIDRLSLILEPGEKVALVGLNGAGKTTLVKLLSGLYRPDNGEILIDGVPLEQFDQEEYFHLVGTVFQDVSLLPFTIGENVAGREEYDRAQVWACLGQAGLKEAAEALPRGLDANLTQQMEKDGVELSGGQRQRLSFARALYKDAPLLILDEPTAALDPLAEADLYCKYARETADKTSVFISHRLGSTQFCDRVVYMEGGRITEMGTHQELLELGGAYAKLFEVQSSWYKDKKEGESREEI